MDLTIITPCFNHGQYLDEMLKSVHNNDWSFDFEHIIVNDGSTDEFTIKKLSEIQDKYRVTVINQKNAGLSASRNVGIKLSKGRYILPLDSDNKINSEVIEDAVKIINDKPEIAVVYTDCEFFGEREGISKVGNIDMYTFLYKNQLDACALIRKQVFSELGNYDENMKWGSEDWDIWLRFLFNDKNFFYLEKIGFYYRVRYSSMSFTDTIPKYNEIKDYLRNKYFSDFSRHSLTYFDKYVKLKSEIDYIKRNRIKSIIRMILGEKIISV